jgi:hypothetical protein
MAEWDPDQPELPFSVWTCPYCRQANSGKMPGRIVWVTERTQDEDGRPS